MSRTLQQRLTFLAALLLICLGYITFQEPIHRFFSSADNKTSPINVPQIQTIKIQNEAETITLQKQNNMWVVATGEARLPADQERISTLLNSFESLSLNDIASNNKERHKDLGIDTNKIIFASGGNETEIYLGNIQSASQYIRVGNSDEVYRVAGLPDILTPFDYRDLSIDVVSQVESVKKVSLMHSRVAVELSKKNNEWFSDDTTLSNSAVNSWLQSIASITADDITQKPDEIGADPLLEVELQEGEITKRFSFYPDAEDSIRLIVSGNDNYVYHVPMSTLDLFRKDLSDFLENEE